MIGHAPSDQCELPRSMDFNGNSWKQAHLEEPERTLKEDTTCPELVKLLNPEKPAIALSNMAVKNNQPTDLVLPTSIQKALSPDPLPTDCTTSADPVIHDQNEEVPGPQSLRADQDTSSASSAEAVVDKSDSEKTAILSTTPLTMLKTVSNGGHAPPPSTHGRSSHSRRKKSAIRNQRKNDTRWSNRRRMGDTKVPSSDRSSPIELEMSCKEDQLDESQLNVRNQYSEEMTRYKEEMNIYVQKMERYFLEKHGLNKNSNKEDYTSSTPPDAFINFSRGVQATPLELSEKDIFINPAIELDLSSNDGKETTDEEESYQHELEERSQLLPSASPLTIPTTQTRMHLTNSAPRNRFQRSGGLVPPPAAAISHSVKDSPGTQVLAELEKVCEHLPDITSTKSPPSVVTTASGTEIPITAPGRFDPQFKTMTTAGRFCSPLHSDVSTSQHNHHHHSSPVSLMQPFSHLSMPPRQQQIAEQQSTGRNLTYQQQHRGTVKRSHPSSSTSPGSSCCNGQKSPEDANRMPDQGPTGYSPLFQPFPGVRPFHHAYPPTTGILGKSNNVRTYSESSIRFPQPNSLRYPEPNSLRYPEPNSLRYPEPNSIRFPEPSSMKFPDPNGRFPEPSGMRFPFPQYGGTAGPHCHMYPPGRRPVGFTEPPHVHPSSSSGLPANRSRNISGGNQQTASSPSVSLPHKMSASQGSHTIKYKPDENQVTACFERTYQEIMQRRSREPSPNVTVRHPWQQHMPRHAAGGGVRPGLQPPPPPPRKSYLRDKLTSASPWFFNQQHPLAQQNAPPRMHQQSYSNYISGNMRGGPSLFNPHSIPPPSNSEWLDCSPASSNMVRDSQPNLSPSVPGSFDHHQQHTLHHPLHPQTDSGSASPSSRQPSPLNPISPVDSLQHPRGPFQPSSVQLNRQPMRGFNHLPPLISVSEPTTNQTQIAVSAAQRLSPKGPPRSENAPSINLHGYIVQSNTSRMPKIASIQSFSGTKDMPNRVVTGPKQGQQQQEPVMPRISHVHSTVMADPHDDEEVLDLSQPTAESQASSQVEKISPPSRNPQAIAAQSEAQVLPVIPKILRVRMEESGGGADFSMGSPLSKILQGMANLTENQQSDAAFKSSLSTLPAVRNQELIIPSVPVREEHREPENNARIPTGVSSSPSDIEQVSTTAAPVAKSKHEKILSVPDLTGRSKILPRIALTGTEYQPIRRASADTREPSPNNRQSHSHKRKKKHEGRSSSKSKKKRSHHSHERERGANFPSVLKIPDVRKALRESAMSAAGTLSESSTTTTTTTHISSEERNGTMSSSETTDDHETSAVENAPKLPDKEMETNPASHDRSESVDTSTISTGQSSSTDVNVTNALTVSSPTFVSSVSAPVMPTPIPYSNALVRLSHLPSVAPPQRAIILQTLLTPRIVVPANITVVQQRNIMVGPILQVSISNQTNQNISIVQSANGRPLAVASATEKNPANGRPLAAASATEKNPANGRPLAAASATEKNPANGRSLGVASAMEMNPLGVASATEKKPANGRPLAAASATEKNPANGRPLGVASATEMNPANGRPLAVASATEKNPEVLDMTKSNLSVIEGTEKVDQEEMNNPTLECYEETLERGVIPDRAATTETSATIDEITVTLPMPDTSSIPSSEGEQRQESTEEKETDLSEETNLFDRVATYMSNLEKHNHNNKSQNTDQSRPEKRLEKLSITSGRYDQKKNKGTAIPSRLKNCTLRLVPRKNKDGDKAAGKSKGSQKMPPCFESSKGFPNAKDKTTAGKWDKYYGYRKGRLPQHQHNTRFRIVCYHCENMMSDNVTYMDHVESVIEKSCPASKIKQFCKICFQTQSTTDALKHIAESHPLDGIYSCKICNVSFSLRKDFKFHMKRVHKGLSMPYVCKICLFQTSFHADLREHFVAEHRGSKALLCHFCTKILYSSRSFLAHFTKHYARESGASCPDCILLFLSNSACKEHLANDHQTFEWNEKDGKPKHESFERQRKQPAATAGKAPKKQPEASIPSKDEEAVIEITDDEEEEEGKEEEEVTKSWKCMECGGSYVHLAEHLITEYSCQSCNYHTQCGSAYTQHVVAFHASFQDAPVLHPVKKSQVFGGYLLKCRKCGFKTSFATNMSEHIVSCPEGVSVLDSFTYLREKALREIALRENHEKDGSDVPEVISVETID